MFATLVLSAVLSTSPCLLPPLTAPVTDPFRDPGCMYCAGNRGVEYAPTAGTPVAAAGAGSVSFAGSVAGTLYIVVEHADGYRTTYGRLQSVAVRRGQAVAGGQPLGATTGRFFFGLRLGDRYLDPAQFLARAIYRPQLIPLDGVHRRPAPPARLACW